MSKKKGSVKTLGPGLGQGFKQGSPGGGRGNFPLPNRARAMARGRGGGVFPHTATPPQTLVLVPGGEE